MGLGIGSIWASIGLKDAPFRKSISRIINRALPALRAGIKKTGDALDRMGNRAIIAGAAISAALGLMGKTFLDAAATAEQFRVRIAQMVGSTKEAEIMFKNLTKIATRVPQTFKQILDAATTLLPVFKGNRKEVEEWIPLILDLQATFSNLALDEVISNFIRMKAAGAAAADLFREKGVLVALGFAPGVAVNTEETMRRVKEALLDVKGIFVEMTLKQAKTWNGLMSMYQDMWFNFRVTAAASLGVFDDMKAVFASLRLVIMANWQEMFKWVEQNREAIRQAFILGGKIALLALAFTGLGISMKAAAFVLGGIALIISPIVLFVGLLAGAIITLRSVMNQTAQGDKFLVFIKGIGTVLGDLFTLWRKWQAINLKMLRLTPLGIVFRKDLNEIIAYVESPIWDMENIKAKLATAKDVFAWTWGKIKDQTNEDVLAILATLRERFPAFAGLVDQFLRLQEEMKIVMEGILGRGPKEDPFLPPGFKARLTTSFTEIGASMETAMSGAFQKILKGGEEMRDGLVEVWESMLDSMLKATADWVAKEIALLALKAGKEILGLALSFLNPPAGIAASSALSLVPAIGGTLRGQLTGGPVRETGYFRLHEGEHVVPRGEVGMGGGEEAQIVPIPVMTPEVFASIAGTQIGRDAIVGVVVQDVRDFGRTREVLG